MVAGAPSDKNTSIFMSGVKNMQKGFKSQLMHQGDLCLERTEGCP